MVSVFVSYVREDALAANWIASELAGTGVDVWLDTERIAGGKVWRDEIATAIERCDFFVPLLSSAWLAKHESVARLELAHAQRRSTALFSKRPRVVPVLLDNCDLSAIDAQLPKPISALHVVKFTGRALWTSLRELSNAMGLHSIRLDREEPLALGLPAHMKIANGAIKTELTEPIQHQIIGSEKQIMRGEIFRAHDKAIRLHLTTRPPFTEGHEFDKALGLDIVSTHTSARYLSTDDKEPTKFTQTYDFVLPRASCDAVRHMGLGPYENDNRVHIEMNFMLAASTTSIHGLVDSFVTLADQDRTLRFKQWAIIQAACA